MTYVFYQRDQQGQGEEFARFTPPGTWSGPGAEAMSKRVKGIHWRGKERDITKEHELLPRIFHGQRLWAEARQ